MKSVIRKVKSREELDKEFKNGEYDAYRTHLRCRLTLVDPMLNLAGKEIRIVDASIQYDANGMGHTRLHGAHWTWLEEWLEPLEPPVVKLKLFDEE